MATEPHQQSEDSTFTKTLALIDPKGDFVPGTREYDWMCDLIRCWIDQRGPDYALRMAEVGAEHFNRWRKLF
jgi:hypothetical protein